MNYDLAKKLKDVGFLQKDKGTLLFANGITLADSQKKWDKNSAYAPTLSELIEACGDKYFFQLSYMVSKKTWFAESKSAYQGQGSTPEEAVANLWLELNKK